MKALRSFLARVDAAQRPAGRERALAREATYVGVDRETWSGLRGADLGLPLLRDLHRAISGSQPRVRRADRDGRWVLAEARPGWIRTKPQSFRSGDHVESAWEQGALKAGLGRLLHEVGPGLAEEPARHGAHLVWSLTRAQPFAGHNEQLALVALSWCLRRAGWPALPVVDVERDAGFVDALAVASADRGPLERYLASALWTEALRYVEWLGPVVTDEHWTLAGEHRMLAAIRADVLSVPRPDVEAFAERASTEVAAALAAQLAIAIEGAGWAWLADPSLCRQLAWESAGRGRWLCPQQALLVVAWRLGDTGVDARLIVGAAGRGMSGALTAHLVIGPPAPGADAAPAFLLIPDEAADERDRRFQVWAALAVDAARRGSALRL
jgi:hypothetical protein